MTRARYLQTIDLGELRADSLKMLRDVTTIFNNADLQYWLDFGTLLGAVRHARTLYWDGDFDLSTMDTRMLDRKEMWDQVRKAGYTILLSEPGEHEYVKIFRESNTVGQFRVDLHRYHETPSGNAEFIVSYRSNRFASFLLKLRNLISISMPPGSEQRVACFKIQHFTSYHKICKSVLNAGIPPQDLEELGPIEYRHGTLNSNMDYELTHSKFHVIECPLTDAKRMTIIATKALQLLPHWVQKRGCAALEIPLHWISKTPDKKSEIPLSSLSELEKVQFHDMEFNCPRNSEAYLEKTYGKNWQVPIHAWETDTDFEGKSGVEN